MSRQFAWIVVLLVPAARVIAADLPCLPASSAPLHLAGPSGSAELTQAAACIERGELTAAIDIIARHVQDHPEQFTVRAYLAEMYWRQDRWPDAQIEFARFIADAQSSGAEPARLIHGHTRLMAIAEKTGDRDMEHLHRGIGLYWLARREPKQSTAECLYCKAAGELSVAERARPDDARPKWYLHQVWSALEQPTRARNYLSAAARQSGFSDLTPAELADLSLARAAESASTAQFP